MVTLYPFICGHSHSQCGIILSVKTIRKFTALAGKFCSKNILTRPNFLSGFALPGVISVFILLSACQQPSRQFGNENQQPEIKLKILTTIAPLYCFAKNIAGDLADVENLLPAGAGPHEYSFSPADIKKIKNAHVLIKNGANLEPRLDKVIASSMEIPAMNRKGKLAVVDTSSGIQLMNNDPHIWLSPKNAIIQVRNIRDALAKADPDRSERYRENAGEYIKRLEKLDIYITEEVKTWRTKEFVAFHSAFMYFARDYGLKQVAVIQEFPDTQPSPKHIAEVIKTIKKTGVKAIFSEPLTTHKIVESIAEDLNLQVYSFDTLETGEPYPEWYEDKMKANLAVLKKALN
ncbi:MAG: metal ABC transporter substrate-binding protein [Thermodesulfovibrionia bacterium]|nr:MAG: metal ABC transporter substrate-binding protein [Thermodesulfovibrionia bacterium]